MPQTHFEIADALDAADVHRFADARVTVVVPDLTRPIDYRRHVAPLLARLADAGAEVTVWAALGLHRPMTDDELAPLRAIAGEHGAELRQHDAHGDDLVELSDDVAHGRPGWPRLPSVYPQTLVDSDALVTVGTVEPHQYAGFSGGAKGVAIGCAGAETIGAMHGLDFLRRKGTRLGAVEENPFQKALWRLIDPLPPVWGLQIVPPTDDLDELTAFGPVGAAFEAATEGAKQRFFDPVDTPFDWLHLPVPDIKAVNFYQASRAATYVALAERPALRRGGTLIVEASCPEGMGDGDGERACAEALARGREALLEELRGDDEIETRGGQQRAYVIALALDRCEVALVGAPAIDVLEEVGIRQFETVEEAKETLGLEGRGETIADVFHAVPILAAGRE